jgi:hypothetical protein
MKVAYVFTHPRDGTYKLGQMILPQREVGVHGVEVAGMFFCDDMLMIVGAFALLLLSCNPAYRTLRGHCLWLGAISLGGFVVFESLILTVDWLLTGSHTLTWAIAQSLFIKETVWAIGLMLIHLFLIRYFFPRPPVPPSPLHSLV